MRRKGEDGGREGEEGGEVAFFCPKLGICCSSSLHLARILPQHNYNFWKCSEKPGEIHGHLAESLNMIIWGTQAAGSSTGTC